MVLTYAKLFPRRVRVLFATSRPKENTGDGQHGDDDEDVQRTFHFLRDDEHFRQGGIQREFNHLAAEFGQLTWKKRDGTCYNISTRGKIHVIES